jgi:6-phosphogluconate dehydrogenase
MKKEIGYIGLGKMGLAQVRRLVDNGWHVVAWNRSEEPRKTATKGGAEVRGTLKEVTAQLQKPRLIWLMVSHKAVDGVLKELLPYLLKGDTVIDGGNSFYRDSMRRAKEFARKGINFLDVGISGGPFGARNGACLMIGGDKRVFRKHERLFKNFAASYSPFSKGSGRRPRDFEILRLTDSPPPLRKEEYRHSGNYAYMGRSGAGHFVKMVHNGIEYGMMQALAEGFNVLRTADGRRDKTRISADKPNFRLNLKQIAELYNKGSVIESRLTGWLAKAFEKHGENLADISGEVAQSGEGLWTVETAKALGVSVKVIKDSLDFRLKSKGNPSYTGQVVSALRNQFGGHDVKKSS